MSSMMMNTNNTNTITMTSPSSNGSSNTVSLHDPDFKSLITVPLSAVHHLPPAHLEISRLVLCRKYDPRNPMNSCPMGESCKFVHLDMTTPQVEVQSIHVNYAYRSISEVPHQRLPAGEMLSVMAPNNKAPSQLIPSDLVLVTKGALQRCSGKAALSHCAHYYFNRSCNRGDRCCFVHALYIDETAGPHQRAPPRAGASTIQRQEAKTQQQSKNTNNQFNNSAAVRPIVIPNHNQAPPAFLNAAPQMQLQMPRVQVGVSVTVGVNRIKTLSPVNRSSFTGSSRGSSSSCDLSESPRSGSEAGDAHETSSVALSSSAMTTRSSATTATYRRNPYSLTHTTVQVE